MFLNNMSQFWKATSVIIGTAIGAGVFAIPYAISRVGFWPIGALYIFTLGLVVILTTLAYGEVVLRTKGRKQMTSYAEYYLGGWAKRLLTFSLGFGFYGALIAYTIGVGQFLSVLLSPYLGGTPVFWSLVFFVLAASAVFKGLKTVAFFEGLMVFFLLCLVALVVLLGLPMIDLSNLTSAWSGWTNLFLPYGVILFAFGAAAAVPDMMDLLKDQKRKLKKAIILGMLFPMIVYLVFAFVAVGVSGGATSQEAVIGLGQSLGPSILFLGALFGIITMSTSFLMLGLILKEVYWYDYKIPHFWSWFLVISVPLIIFLLKLISFVEVIGTAGAIMGGFEGIIILFMWEVARKKGERTPEYSLRVSWPVAALLFLVFALGIIYQVYYTFFS